jgi:hypothetical protein
MKTLIALLISVLSIATAAADQYNIIPYATSKPEGSQLETLWRVMVINESKPELAYCQATTKIYSGDCVVSVKCRGQQLKSGSPPVGQVTPHGIPNETVFQIGGSPPWWGIDQTGALSFCCRNSNPPNTFSCASTPIPAGP